MNDATWASAAYEKLASGRTVRQPLPGGGQMYMDRALPFLCVHRRRPGMPHDGIERLIAGQAAHAFRDAKGKRDGDAEPMVSLLRLLSERFQAFLLLEVWEAAPSPHSEGDGHASHDEHDLFGPAFRVVTEPGAPPRDIVERLLHWLGRTRIGGQLATVQLATEKRCAPPGLARLLPVKTGKSLNVYLLGIEVRPIYRDPTSGENYPAVLHKLRRAVGRAIDRAFFTFARSYTTLRASHYAKLRRRSFVKAVWEVDRKLAEFDRAFDLILLATPTNMKNAWNEFRRHGEDRAPLFVYRPTPIAGGELKRRLFSIPIQRVEDVTLEQIFREKQDELDRKITMLEDIGTPHFFHGSMQVYGWPEEDLVAEARRILQQLVPYRRQKQTREKCTSQLLASEARKEVDYYTSQDPTFHAEVRLREDLPSGFLASAGDLMIGRDTEVPRRRVQALMHHEIGVHLLTRHNGAIQPFRLLSVGLAGYDALQEGLALLAEYLSGGLTPQRMRVIAARVIAVDSLRRGAMFIDTYRELNQGYGFSKFNAFHIAMRVHRGGGLTKDALYLRGWREILQFVLDGGHLETLLVGKFARHHVPLVRELLLREVIQPARLHPRFLEASATAWLTERLRTTPDTPELIKESPPCELASS